MGNNYKNLLLSVSWAVAGLGCSVVNVYHQGEKSSSYLSIGRYQADTFENDIAIQTTGFGIVPTQSGWTLGYVEEAYASIRDGHACRLIVFSDNAPSLSANRSINNSIEVMNDEFLHE